MQLAFSDAEIRELMTVLDDDQDGLVAFEDFKRIMDAMFPQQEQASVLEVCILKYFWTVIYEIGAQQ